MQFLIRVSMFLFFVLTLDVISLREEFFSSKQRRALKRRLFANLEEAESEVLRVVGRLELATTRGGGLFVDRLQRDGERAHARLVRAEQAIEKAGFRLRFKLSEVGKDMR